MIDYMLIFEDGPKLSPRSLTNALGPCGDLLEAYNHAISRYWFDCQRPCLTVVGVWLS